MESAAKAQYVQSSKPVADIPRHDTPGTLPTTGIDVAFLLVIAAVLTLVGVFLRGLVKD